MSNFIFKDEDARLADGITEVKNVVQEQFEDDVIASTLKDYDFNPSKALEVLLGKRSSNSSNGQLLFKSFWEQCPIIHNSSELLGSNTE